MDKNKIYELTGVIAAKIIDSNKDDIKKEKKALKEQHEKCIAELRKSRDIILKKHNIITEKLTEILEHNDGDLETNPGTENEIANEFETKTQKIMNKYNFDSDLEKEIGFFIEVECDEHTVTFMYSTEVYEISYWGAEDNFRIELNSNLHEDILNSIKEYFEFKET